MNYVQKKRNNISCYYNIDCNFGQIAKANLLVDNKILKIKTVDELNKLVFQFDLSLDDYIYPNYYTPEKALEVNDRAEIIAVVSRRKD